jgi:Zn-dependent metalloprotease
MCCFIPVHIQAALVRYGNANQRAFAINSLQLDSSFRQVRLGFVEYNRSRFAAARAQRQARALKLGRPSAGGKPQRTIYTADEKQRDPGTEVRREGQPASGDNEIDESYNGLGATYNLYWQVYQRNSIDNQGMPLSGTVHYGYAYDNAFWDGQRMNYGDGDGVTFNRFTISVDIMGHELTHGVTQHESNLIYWGQTGALNEHISDVFGSLVKQYQLKQSVNQADWLIGSGLLMPGINGVAIRSLKAPGTAYDDPALGGKDPQPALMKDYVQTFQDNGGVHINSGIPNHAFYLAATAIGGNAWEKTGLIWYQTCLSPLLRETANFQTFAKLTVTTAQQLFGIGSQEASAVASAWNAVGINV